MKNQIFKHQSFKAVSYVMNKYSAVFAEKAEVLAAKEEFETNNERMRVLLSQLLRPVSAVRNPRKYSDIQLRKQLSQVLGLGITLATSQNNLPLLETFKGYSKQLVRCSSYQLCEMSTHTHEELSKLQDIASGNGLTPAKLLAFQENIQLFADTLDNTGFQLNDRRKSRNDLSDLIKANNRILRLQLDTFVRFAEIDHFDLFQEYTFVRKRKSSRAKVDVSTEDQVDISGTVTDSETGLPIANATINIVDYSQIERTDTDGYYLIDELPPANYLVHCYAPNYEVSEAFSVDANSGESVVLDIALIPLATATNKSA